MEFTDQVEEFELSAKRSPEIAKPTRVAFIARILFLQSLPAWITPVPMRIVRILIVILAILAGSVFAGKWALGLMIDRGLQALVRDSRDSKVELTSLEYGRLSILKSGITFHDARGSGVSRFQHDYVQPRRFDLSIDQIRVSVLEIQSGFLRISVEILGLNALGGRHLGESPLSDRRIESMAATSLQTDIFLETSPHLWKLQILDRIRAINAWAFANKPIHNLETHGTATVVMDGQTISLRFHSVADHKGVVQLEGNVDDLRAIATVIEPNFTEADLRVTAKNLLKAPAMMSIRYKAELRAIRLNKRDPEIRYDVPRHIFWSYWLTRSFGPEFARQVTAAHETGDMRNSRAGSARDHLHNELGIEYAMQQLTEAQVEELVFKDPRVVRQRLIRHRPAACRKNCRELPSKPK